MPLTVTLITGLQCPSVRSFDRQSLAKAASPAWPTRREQGRSVSRRGGVAWRGVRCESGEHQPVRSRTLAYGAERD